MGIQEFSVLFRQLLRKGINWPGQQMETSCHRSLAWVLNGKKQKGRDRIWGEAGKNSFIALPGTGGHSRQTPQRLCPLGEGTESVFFRLGPQIRSRVEASWHSSSELVLGDRRTGSGGPPLCCGFSSAEELKHTIMYIP